MKIDPKTIQFQINLNVEQGGLILSALAKLPIEQALGLFEGIRSATLQAIKDAEAAEVAEVDVAQPVADVPTESAETA